MSGREQLPGQAPHEERRRRREQARRVWLLALAALIVAFGVLNLKEVRVNWIVGAGHAPLIIVIVVSLVVGVALGHFAERRSARRR
jgi:uncharacterized integral membrane protein